MYPEIVHGPTNILIVLKMSSQNRQTDTQTHSDKNLTIIENLNS